MPRGRKNAKDLLSDIDSLEGGRAGSANLERQEKKRKQNEVKEIEKKNRRYTILYIVISILVFGLGLLVIATLNYAFHGQFTL